MSKIRVALVIAFTSLLLLTGTGGAAGAGSGPGGASDAGPSIGFKAPDGTTNAGTPGSPGWVRPKLEIVDVTGLVGRERAAWGWQALMRDDYLTLQSSSSKFQLLRAHDRRLVTKIEDYVGKTITVKGYLVLPHERHPLPALKVISFVPLAEIGAEGAPGSGTGSGSASGSGSGSGSNLR